MRQRGAYAEYGFNRNLGIKAEVTFNKERLILGNGPVNNQKAAYELSCIDINPNLKIDFGKVYRKGFYLLIAPKIGLLTSVKPEVSNGKAGFYASYFAADMGFGLRILKIIEFEAKYDYGLTPFYKTNNAALSGFYVSPNVDVEKIINTSNHEEKLNF